VSKVIWQTAALPIYHSIAAANVLFDLDPHLTHGSLGQQESALQTASRSLQQLCTVHPCDQHTHRQTDMQTTLRVTSVAIGRIYASSPTHAIRSKMRTVIPMELRVSMCVVGEMLSVGRVVVTTSNCSVDLVSIQAAWLVLAPCVAFKPSPVPDVLFTLCWCCSAHCNFLWWKAVIITYYWPTYT